MSFIIIIIIIIVHLDYLRWSDIFSNFVSDQDYFDAKCGPLQCGKRLT